jgi:hypothetical protein
MKTIRLFAFINLGALMLHATGMADPIGPSPNAGQNARNQNGGSNADAQAGGKSAGSHQATNEQPDVKHPGKGHAIDNSGKPAPANTSNAHDDVQHQDKQANAAGKQQSDKGTPGSNMTSADSADLRPSHQAGPEPPKPLHPDDKQSGKGAAKAVAKGSPTKGAPQPSTVRAGSAKTPAAPMASAEAASTKGKQTPPSQPMASVEAAAVQKKTSDLHDAGAMTLEKADAKPETDKIPNDSGLVTRQRPGSSPNGTSSPVARGKTPPLAVIDGSKVSKPVKSTASLNGTGIR